MIKVVIVIINLLLLATPSAAENPMPFQDRENLLNFYKKKFPDKKIEEYTYGALMFSEDAKSQYHSIMQFAPFEEDIDNGRQIWETPFKNGKYFTDCFPANGVGEAAKYPLYDKNLDRIVTFEMKINDCLEENGESPFAHNDVKTMGILTSYARKLSDGFPTKVVVKSEGALAKYLNGKEIFFKRMGQLNLSCASCHISHAGNYFRDELISPAVGHTTHFPVFRGGEFLFTLHMRYQRCMEAMRVTPFPAGGQKLSELEFFHSFLSNNLPLHSSVYRK